MEATPVSLAAFIAASQQLHATHPGRFYQHAAVIAFILLEAYEELKDPASTLFMGELWHVARPDIAHCYADCAEGLLIHGKNGPEMAALCTLSVATADTVLQTKLFVVKPVGFEGVRDPDTGLVLPVFLARDWVKAFHPDVNMGLCDTLGYCFSDKGTWALLDNGAGAPGAAGAIVLPEFL